MGLQISWGQNQPGFGSGYQGLNNYSGGGTLRIRIKTNSSNPTRTPEKMAVIQRLIGTKYRKIKKPITAASMINMKKYSPI